MQGLYVGHIRRRKGRVRRQLECVGIYVQRIPNTSADLQILGYKKININNPLIIYSKIDMRTSFLYETPPSAIHLELIFYSKIDMRTTFFYETPPSAIHQPSTSAFISPLHSSMHKYINNKDMWESVEIELKRYFEDSFFLDGKGEYRDLTGEVIKRNVMRKMMYSHYTFLVHGNFFIC